MKTEEIINEYRPNPGSKVVFVTGRLASKGLARVLESLVTPDFSYEIRILNVEVAAWLDVSMVADQIGDLTGISTVIIPGKTTGDDEELAQILGIEVVRGPVCYSELPVFLEEIGLDENSSEEVASPKVLILNNLAVASYLSSTYEVPLLDLNSIIQKEINDNTETGEKLKTALDNAEDLPHNILIELIRAETSLMKGWIINGYPNTMRAVEWLTDLNFQYDAVLVNRGDSSDVGKHYEKSPYYIEIDTSKRLIDMEKDALIQVETLMQTCIIPDFGLASE